MIARLFRMDLRRIAIICVVILGISATHAVAEAGQYNKSSQTGGEMTNSPGPPYSTPYSSTSNGYGGAFGGGNWSKCTGEITTTFAWAPSYVGELPPSQVLVAETCEASYQTDAYPSGGSGSCDNGLGHPTIVSTGGISGPGGGSIGQTDAGLSDWDALQGHDGYESSDHQVLPIDASFHP